MTRRLPLLPLCLALLSLLLPAARGIAQKKGLAPLPQDKVGLVTRDITPARPRNWRGVPDRSLHVTLWYPAPDTAIETPQFLGPPGAPLFQAGSATPHAPFAPSLQPFPLILLSPGAGSSAGQMAWLGTALARAGFVAAAVDHPGSSTQSGLTPAGFALWWERAADLSDVLDGLLADPELSPHLDRTRIGAAGFALGGFTVLEMAGARTDIASFYDLCRANADDAVCQEPELRDLLRRTPGEPAPETQGEPASGASGEPASEAQRDSSPPSPHSSAPKQPHTLEQLLAAVRAGNGESLARSEDSYRDPRIRAVFAMAPTLGFTFTPDSLRALRVPVALVVGGADTVAPAASSADPLRAHLRGVRETTLPGVGHYDFLDTCTAGGEQAEPRRCADPPTLHRDAVHGQTAALAAAFFARALQAPR